MVSYYQGSKLLTLLRLPRNCETATNCKVHKPQNIGKMIIIKHCVCGIPVVEKLWKFTSLYLTWLIQTQKIFKWYKIAGSLGSSLIWYFVIPYCIQPLHPKALTVEMWDSQGSKCQYRALYRTWEKRIWVDSFVLYRQCGNIVIQWKYWGH